jgi:hypothetical protein
VVAVLVDMQDLRSGLRRIAENVVYAGVATALIDLTDEVEPIRLRKQQLLPQEQRRRKQLRAAAVLT